jgi:hypothetical protein
MMSRPANVREAAARLKRFAPPGAAKNRGFPAARKELLEVGRRAGKAASGFLEICSYANNLPVVRSPCSVPERCVDRP